MTQSPSRRRRLAARTALALAAGIAGLYGAELAFRSFFLDWSVPRNEREFERVVASTWPGPVERPKPTGTVRILGLSDSFGVAGGARNYHPLLETLLRDEGWPVEVVNFSVPAYAPADQLRLLQSYAAAYEPDIVLHGFFVGNDFAARGQNTMGYRGINVEVIRGLSGWRPSRLMLWRWTSRWLEGWQDRRLREREIASGETAGSFSRESFLRIEAVRLATCRRPARAGPAWPLTTELLDAILGEVDLLGAVHVLVVHPDQFQVEPALAREVMEAYALDPVDYDLELPLGYLRAWAASRSVALVDLSGPFREQGRAGGLYLPLDTHYSDAGNALAARTIAGKITPLLTR